MTGVLPFFAAVARIPPTFRVISIVSPLSASPPLRPICCDDAAGDEAEAAAKIRPTG